MGTIFELEGLGEGGRGVEWGVSWRGGMGLGGSMWRSFDLIFSSFLWSLVLWGAGLPLSPWAIWPMLAFEVFAFLVRRQLCAIFSFGIFIGLDALRSCLFCVIGLGFGLAPMPEVSI